MSRPAAWLLAALLLGSGTAVFAKAAPAAAARAKAFAALPDWRGLWLTENDETTIGGLAKAQVEGRGSTAGIMRLFGFNAPWNDEGKARQAARARLSAGRKADGWGYPMMMNGAAPIQFLVTPEEVLIINAYRDVRHIYTDGRKHPGEDDLWPTVWGDSVGHWEGDTLVVDTIAVKNPNDYFHGGPALSDAAHYIERIRLAAPGRIEDDITIDDPTTLARPWVTKLTFTPAKGFDRMIHDNYDNDRTGFDGKTNTIEPPKDESPN